MAEEDRAEPATGAGGTGNAGNVLGAFDRDTAVQRRLTGDSESETAVYDATIAPGWRAGRGPHGGYLAAMILRALTDAVGEAARAPRSLTIHYLRAPIEGPVEIECTSERHGRSLTALSARMLQEGRPTALALAAFSLPWPAPEISDLQMPDVAPADPARVAGAQLPLGAPDFNRHIVLQPRIGGLPLGGPHAPMDVAGWIGLDPPRPLDALSLAFYCDAFVPPVMIRMGRRVAVPTVDLTIHFRATLPLAGDGDPDALCFASFSSRVAHEGFFEEDGVIWAPDGTVLAQSRQLGVVIDHDAH